jgi:hypothetical protein
MYNRVACFVRLQITFRYIGAKVAFVDKHVIPGEGFRRFRRGHLGVPILCIVKFGVGINDDTSINKVFVMD